MSQLAPDRPHSPEATSPAPCRGPGAAHRAPRRLAVRRHRPHPRRADGRPAARRPADAGRRGRRRRHGAPRQRPGRPGLADDRQPGSEDSVVDLPRARLLPLEPGTLTPGPADRGPRRLRVSHVGRDLDVVVTLVREGAPPCSWSPSPTSPTPSPPSGSARPTPRPRRGPPRGGRGRRRHDRAGGRAPRSSGCARSSGGPTGPTGASTRADRTLKFTLESATPDRSSARSQALLLRRGVGLSGGPGAAASCSSPRPGRDDRLRARPVAQRVGVKSGVCFPIVVDGDRRRHHGLLRHETLSPSPSASRRCATSGVSSPPRWSGSLATTPRRPPRPTSPRRSSRCSRSCAPPPPAT